MDVYGIVPRQGYGKPNNYALVCLGAKEATQTCQAKDFEYYCDTDGEVKNKGKYNDEECGMFLPLHPARFDRAMSASQGVEIETHRTSVSARLPRHPLTLSPTSKPIPTVKGLLICV